MAVGTLLYGVEVAVPCPLPQTFTYSSPVSIARGQRVLVSFGKRSLVGVALGCKAQESIEKEKFELKPVLEVLDEEPAYSEVLLELAGWMSRYYHHPIGEVFRTMLSAGVRKGKKVFWEPTPKGAASAEVSALFGKKGRLSQATLAKKAKAAGTTLRAWQSAGLIRKTEEKTVAARKLDPRGGDRGHPTGPNLPDIGSSRVSPISSPISLNSVQAQAVQAILASSSKPFLLWGVTGSGKTEVYLHVLAALFEGQPKAQALILVPEISLTPQMTQVFTQRFPEQIAVVHSAQSDEERWEQLARIRSGSARVLIGARSAVFAPFVNLKLLVVDEEHDPSYKQDSMLPYQARDIAVLRGKLEGARVVLGSATPSLESFWNAQTGRYELLRLPTRVREQALPAMQVVAMHGRRFGVAFAKEVWREVLGDKSFDGISDKQAAILLAPEIVESLREVLAREEQAMVLVNRRGYAHYLLNIDRGEPISCPQCSISLTLHRKDGRLRCHYCDYQSTIAQLSETGETRLFAVGSGSQKIEAALRAVLPEARIARLDSDVIKKREKLAEVLADYRDGKIDLLVGTQILAKGHDFPKVTLIVMLELDPMLDFPDFRAGERTFQLMVQAAGRTGRADRSGRVLVQTARKDHPIVEAGLRHDYEAFAQRELAFRKAHDYPPFGRLIALEFSCLEERPLTTLCYQIEGWLEASSTKTPELFTGLKVLGPAVPNIERIRGRFRRTLIFSSREAKQVHKFLHSFRAEFHRLPAGVRLNVDVDPQSLL